MPWAVIFPGDAAQSCPGITDICARHPSQLYEAFLEGFLVFIILFLYRKHKKFDGELMISSFPKQLGIEKDETIDLLVDTII